MKLNITSLSPSACVVSFADSTLDAGNVKPFRDAIAASLAERSVLVLNMEALTFVDSSGLGALLSCLRSMNSKDGKLMLAGVTRPVMALLELVRMHRLFAIHDSVQDALDDACVVR